MSDGTSIEWAALGLGKGASWSPVRARNLVTRNIGWFCEKVSDGCSRCYAERLNRDRFGTMLPYKPGHRADVEIYLDEKTLLQPPHWRAPRGVFVCSMTDLFGDWVPDEWIDKILAVAALCPQHRFAVLTKRSARMRAYMSNSETKGRIGAIVFVDKLRSGAADAESYRSQEGRLWPLPNVWLLVSAENQQRADERIPELLATPAAVRGVSIEPMLGPVDLRQISDRKTFSLDALDGTRCFPYDERSFDERGFVTAWCCRDDDAFSKLDWIIVGGESGPSARPMNPAWARDLRDQCAATGTAFHFKQWGTWADVNQPENGALVMESRERHFWPDKSGQMMRVGKKRAGRLLDGRQWDQFPGDEKWPT